MDRTIALTVKDSMLDIIRLFKKGESVVIEIDNTTLSIGINVHGEFYITDLEDVEKEIIIS